MGNLRLKMRSASSKNNKEIVGRFKADGGCKKHSKHRQSPGVCSLCLREKLTQLTIPTPRIASTCSSSSSSVSSLSSYHSSSSASSCASPMHRHFIPFNTSTTSTTSHSSSLVSTFLHGAGANSKKPAFWYRLLHAI